MSNEVTREELDAALTRYMEHLLQEAKAAAEAEILREVEEISARLDALERELAAKHTDHPAGRVKLVTTTTRRR